MSEEKKNTTEEKKVEKATDVKDVKGITKDTNAGAAKAVAKSVFGAKKKFKKNFKKKDERRDDFEQRILDLARVTRVMAGGKRMRFRATVAVGDKKGKVGIGMGKGTDVAIAVNKGVNEAKKNLIEVQTVNDTIPHEVYKKLGASKLLFKPAKRGKGVVAGGIVRVILELAGIKNISSKILGTNNKVNNAKCTIEALKELKQIEMKKPEKKPLKKTEKKENAKIDTKKKKDS